MSEIFLTPEDTAGETVELSRTMMRKRVLPKGTINYKGRKIVFDDAYLSTLVDAYKDGAYDHVPVQMADEKNAHTMDPERFGGEIAGLELADDGLYATFAFTERGAQLVKDNPNLGVSARLVGNYERSDGKHYQAAMQHVLLTQDPRIPGLGAWTEVDLSGYHDSDQVIDLTNASYEGDSAVADGNENTETSEVSEDDIREALKLIGTSDEEIEAFFAEIEASEDGDDDGEETRTDAETPDDPNRVDGDGDDDDRDNDAEDSADIVAETEEGKELVAALSNDDDADTDTVDLANQDMAVRLAAAEKQLAESRFEAEKAKWVAKGVPPAFIDLAQDILTAPAGTSVVDLSNGPGEDNKVDAADVIRKMIETTAGYVRIAAERGHDIQLSNEPEDKTANTELANVWDAIVARSKPQN